MTTKNNSTMTTRQLADAILNMQNVLVGLQSQIATLTQSQTIVGDAVRDTRKNNAKTEVVARRANNHRIDCVCGTCKRIDANKARGNKSRKPFMMREHEFGPDGSLHPVTDWEPILPAKKTSPKRTARKTAAVSFDPIFETLVPAVKAAQTRNYRNVNISALFKGDVRVFLPSRFNRAFRNWYRANDVHRIDAAKMLVEAMKVL